MSNLFDKYNVPGPRYTSYPTVPYWDKTPTEQEWIQTLKTSLQEAKQKQIGASLYIHIPFCESLCSYCGCNTRITRNHAVAKPYIDTVLEEWNIYQSLLNETVSISELHLGGGTPTFLSPEELQFFLDSLLNKVAVLEGKEFSIEADPRVTTLRHLEVLREFGFTRLSLGIQDFDLKVQQAVNRKQSIEQIKQITEHARNLGYLSINYDLIYGLPFQTPQTIKETIQTVGELKPDRIAYYAYAHVPWIKPSQRRFTEADLPVGQEKRILYELGRTLLESMGYVEIGMDHFSLKTDSLWSSSQTHKLHRNFMGYTTQEVFPQIGLGVSAISDSWQAFIQNEKLLEKYIALVKEKKLPLLRGHLLSPEDLILRRLILNLMTRLEAEWSVDQETFAPHLKDTFLRLEEMKKDGFVELLSSASGVSKVQITNTGRAFMRNICMSFDARLIQKAPGTKLFSQTI